MFADDTAIIASDRFIKKLVNHVQKSAKNIINYYKKWKISINGDKTEVMFHTRRRRKQLPPESIVVDRTVVPRSSSVKYLGFHLDNRLTFKHHINKTLLKTNNLCRMLYPMLRKDGVTTRKLKLKIYKTYVRPTLLYAAPLLDSVAATNKKLLQIKQNKMLRIILERDRRARIVDMHEDSGLPSIKDYLNTCNIKFEQKCEYSTNVNIVNMTR